MKQSTLLSLGFVAIATMATAAHAATYEIRRLTVRQDLSGKICSENVCILKPNEVIYHSELNGVVSERKETLMTDAAAVQKHIEAAPSLVLPDLSNASKYTNWWVRSSSIGDWKLVRTNVTYQKGTNYVRNAEGPSGTFLPEYEGYNCNRNFAD